MQVTNKTEAKENTAPVLSVQGRQKAVETLMRKETKMCSCEMSIVFRDLPKNSVLRKIKKIVQENGGEFLE